MHGKLNVLKIYSRSGWNEEDEADRNNWIVAQSCASKNWWGKKRGSIHWAVILFTFNF